MKIRQLPEDFIVEEILDKSTLKEGEAFNLYQLKKINMENLRTLSYISKRFKIPLKEIGYCGLKDRHAITIQHITIPARYGILSLKEKNLELKYLGKVGSPLKLGQLSGNRFKISIRYLKKEHLPGIEENLKRIHLGVPNYYDTQRFGSVYRSGEFIAREYMMGNYEEALKIILTRYKKSESKLIKDLKRYIRSHWGDWTSILTYMKERGIRDRMFHNIISHLQEGDEERFKEAFKYVDIRLKKLFVSAYQSYLWNECVKTLLKKYIPKENRIYIDYNCGTFLFYRDIDREILDTLRDKTFPTITHDLYTKDIEEGYREIIEEVLKREGLKIEDFNRLLHLSKPSYTERRILSIPEHIRYGEFLEDELNRGRYKITVDFQLGKGCYATMVIKGITSL
ncbi:MAG TPA: tRNA pseudouridine(13) synthase TruD [Methanothermococcus okinawensis]|uniref:tRNA pseudouridine(13) synthase TruD n=1 Tax=Methanothermococcus okinawensis TaxID=155863 RepID=A0A833E1S5_9EURY|nr:tRNA pseudouridine(13) synthase TruD [Methanococcaceae archaeon]HIP84456.1 tRNA pseudouridine(13) synthase TruD [Methanothermococcus okinawensis]HIP90722.1 tRNA pseudouridine(13) synthase TruD [Methanothermococcus okinawensis]